MTSPPNFGGLCFCGTGMIPKLADFSARIMLQNKSLGPEHSYALSLESLYCAAGCCLARATICVGLTKRSAIKSQTSVVIM